MIEAYGPSTMRFRVQGPYYHWDVIQGDASPDGGTPSRTGALVQWGQLGLVGHCVSER